MERRNCILLRWIFTGILTFQFSRIKATNGSFFLFHSLFLSLSLLGDHIFSKVLSRVERAVRFPRTRGRRTMSARRDFLFSGARADASRRREIESSRWKFAFVWAVPSQPAYPSPLALCPCVRRLYRFPYTTASSVPRSYIEIRWILIRIVKLLDIENGIWRMTDRTSFDLVPRRRFSFLSFSLPPPSPSLSLSFSLFLSFSRYYIFSRAFVESTAYVLSSFFFHEQTPV